MPLTAGTTIGAQYRWKKGQSGNPTGRSKIDFDLAEAARAHSPAMLQVAIDIALDESMPSESRLRAVEIVLSRGHGRPMQAVAIDQRVGHFDMTSAYVEALREYATEATPARALPAAE